MLVIPMVMLTRALFSLIAPSLKDVISSAVVSRTIVSIDPGCDKTFTILIGRGPDTLVFGIKRVLLVVVCLACHLGVHDEVVPPGVFGGCVHSEELDDDAIAGSSSDDQVFGRRLLHGLSWDEKRLPINVIHRHIFLARRDEPKELDDMDEHGIGIKIFMYRQSGGSCASCILKKSLAGLAQD